MMAQNYPTGDKRRSRSGDGGSTRTEETMSVPGTPKGIKSQFLSETLQTAVRLEPFRKKAKVAKRNKWTSVSRYAPSDEAMKKNEAGYRAFSLVVRLRFSGQLVIDQATTRYTTPVPSESTQPANSAIPNNFTTPATTREVKALHTPQTMRSISSVHDYIPFERSWVDETQDFNMREVCSTIRRPNTPVNDLGKNYTWYDDAVAADALLPPGIPLSAKELLAYYPHHIRWTCVMLRLSNNDYRGAEIVGIQEFFRGPPDQNTTPAAMNQYQRDALKTIIPGFKTDTLNSKHNRNIQTAHLTPGRYIQDKRSGYTIPTFDDLLRGLHHLPSGLDARNLTECLNWYLGIRDTFTPRLDLNVLHTQALIRALRIPLKPFGPQNLDCNALKEWKDNGRFPERRICAEAVTKENTTASGEDGKGGDARQRSQLHLNLDSHTVDLALQLPLRHVLTFPFLALHGVMGEALKHGIVRAETRQMERENRDAKETLEAKWAARLSGDMDNAGFDEQQEPAKQGQETIKSKPLSPQTTRHEIGKADADVTGSYHGPPRALTASALRTLAPAPRKRLYASLLPANNGPLATSRVPTGPSTLASSPFSPRSVDPFGAPYARGNAGTSAFSPAYGRRGYEGRSGGGGLESGYRQA